ncbi:MAG TPA: hypothetical protein VF463_16330 [Sphingobium sp.]
MSFMESLLIAIKDSPLIAAILAVAGLVTLAVQLWRLFQQTLAIIGGYFGSAGWLGKRFSPGFYDRRADRCIEDPVVLILELGGSGSAMLFLAIAYFGSLLSVKLNTLIGIRVGPLDIIFVWSMAFASAAQLVRFFLLVGDLRAAMQRRTHGIQKP